MLALRHGGKGFAASRNATMTGLPITSLRLFLLSPSRAKSKFDKREGGGMGFMPNESHETGDVGSGGEKRTGRTAMREEGKEK